MSLLAAIIIGILAGLAGAFLLLQQANFLLSNLLVGITGSIVGLVFYSIFLRPEGATTSLFDLRAILSSAIGASFFVMGYNRLNERASKKTTHKDLDTSQEDVNEMTDES